MLQALIERRKDDQGFTLVELMIVVLIIGILLGIGLPTFLGARERAQNRAAEALLRNAVTAAKVYYTDDSTYTAFNEAAAELVEPSIDFAGSDIGTVGITKADADVLCLATLSAFQSTPYVAIDTGAGAIWIGPDGDAADPGCPGVV